MLLGVGLFSCTEEVPEYKKGVFDLEGCYGVYFPTQDKSIGLAPEDSMVAVIKVARLNTNGKITVPFTISNTDDLVKAGEIVFDDGDADTTLTLTFDGAEAGKPYAPKITIDNPEYALVYGDSAWQMPFNILVEKWLPVKTTCWFTENIMNAAYGTFENQYEVYVEKMDGKNIFRIANMFYSYKDADGKEYKHPQYGGSGYIAENEIINKNATVWTKIDCDGSVLSTLDPNFKLNEGEAWIPPFPLNVAWAEGPMVAGSVWYNLKSAGVIVGPDNPAGFTIGSYDETSTKIDFGSMYLKISVGIGLSKANSVLYLDKSKMTDYSLSLDALDFTDSDTHTQTVTVTAGNDIERVDYSIYYGALNSAQIATKSDLLSQGKETDFETISDAPGETELEIEIDSSGMYTLVAVGFSKGDTARTYAGITFSYVADGDDEHNLNISGSVLESASTETTLSFNVVGRDIKNLQLGLYTLDEVYTRAFTSINGRPYESPEVLEQVNGNGYTVKFSGLTPGTFYCLLGMADNGFVNDLTFFDFGEMSPMVFGQTHGELYQSSLDDVLGTFRGFYNSLFDIYGFMDGEIPDVPTYMDVFNIVESDSVDFDVMFVNYFFGINIDNAIYANYDETNNTLNIPCGQIITELLPAAGGAIQLMDKNKPDGTIILDVMGKGILGRPLNIIGFGIVSGPLAGYPFDAICDFDAMRAIVDDGVYATKSAAMSHRSPRKLDLDKLDAFRTNLGYPIDKESLMNRAKRFGQPVNFRVNQIAAPANNGNILNKKANKTKSDLQFVGF